MEEGVDGGEEADHQLPVTHGVETGQMSTGQMTGQTGQMTAGRREMAACSGAVSDSRITYSPPAVGAEVSRSIGFTLHDLGMTQLTLHLPQLSRAGYANPPGRST